LTRLYSLDQILEVYRGHPLSRASILARLTAQNISMDQVREIDLAVDTATDITDQNHIGGSLSTLRLGSLAALSRGERVLDLGCGIGGPARLLAEIFGCAVHGVDANPDRILDATALSAIVRLDTLTTFEHVDYLNFPFQRKYNAVWAQNTWIHIDDPPTLVGIAESALVESGQLIFEDVYLRRAPATSVERRLLDQIEDVWRSSFSELSRWVGALEEHGFKVPATENDDKLFLEYFELLSDRADRNPDLYPAHEVVGWRCARDLARSGVLGYIRIIGCRTVARAIGC
jgi:SAM-dependent methyltransferase